eukprot:GHVU01173748.1.p1 GENE.GHVU01173748.1~~GHVU01173748.1.p1  ORF type:complete len:126 (+),score=2.60 GHVU01173748.1:1661-2038(+)
MELNEFERRTTQALAHSATLSLCVCVCICVHVCVDIRDQLIVVQQQLVDALRWSLGSYMSVRRCACTREPAGTRTDSRGPSVTSQLLPSVAHSRGDPWSRFNFATFFLAKYERVVTLFIATVVDV